MGSITHSWTNFTLFANDNKIFKPTNLCIMSSIQYSRSIWNRIFQGPFIANNGITWRPLPAGYRRIMQLAISSEKGDWHISCRPRQIFLRSVPFPFLDNYPVRSLRLILSSSKNGFINIYSLVWAGWFSSFITYSHSISPLSAVFQLTIYHIIKHFWLSKDSEISFPASCFLSLFLYLSCIVYFNRPEKN